MSNDLSVIVPCFNEEKNITELTERIIAVFRKLNISGEVVLVNDGSTDQTNNVINTLHKTYSDHVIPVHHKTNLGIEAGWNSGVNAATGYYCCLIDADLQNQPEDIERLYREIEHGQADIVQGYRRHVGTLKDSRVILSKTLNVILNICFSMNAKDNKSGFILTPKVILTDILAHRFSYKYYQTFITVSAKKKTYRIKEIETIFESRLLGKSFISTFPLALITGVLWDVCKAFVEFNILNQRQHTLSEFLKNKPSSSNIQKMRGWRKVWFSCYLALMPLHHWMISKHAGTYYQELNQSQWLSLKDIREYQLKKLQHLVTHAYHHVSFFRDVMHQKRIKPTDVSSLEDIQLFPLLDKQTIKDNLYGSILSDNHDKKRVQKITTSGSTGLPFQCFVDAYQLEMRWAATLRGMEMTGWKFGDKQLRLWHQTLGLRWTQILKEKLDAFFLRRTFVPVFEISKSNIQKILKKIHTLKPTLIDGYAEVFNLFASYAKQEPSLGVSFPAVMTSAQSLPDHHRQTIEQELQGTVFDKYGSREFSGIAYECDQHEGHHIVSENYIVEIIKDGQPAAPGEIGEVVITDLNNKCLPFIRYRIGDLAVAMDDVPCSCGRGLPRIGDIQGRTQSIVICQDGTYLPGTFFSHFFKDYDYMISQYQIFQDKQGFLKLSIVKASRFDENQFNDCIKKLKTYIGENTKLNIFFLSQIPLSKTGKHQSVLSTIDFDFQTNNPSLNTHS